MVDIYNINIIIKSKTETEKYYVDTFKEKERNRKRIGRNYL